MSDTVSPGSLFIVDNSNSDWKVRSYLLEWCALSKAMDIATGYFEIGALLALDDKWQSVDQIRILLGDEVSLRTRHAFADGLNNITRRLDNSLEAEKSRNDFLHGVPAIVEAIRSGKIQCRVYRRAKFHAKACVTHGRSAVIGSYGLVGSSNFTAPGLTDNVELNVQIRGTEVGLLQEWYERHWQEAEDITPDILRTLERHTSPRTPFEVWFKSLDEFFRGEALTPDLWDQQTSQVFPLLDKYQRDAYKNLVTIANTCGGAFLCDGVGLGKTFVGLMLLERMVAREGKRAVLFAPKSAREDVWERAILKYLPSLNSRFVNMVLYNHTDLQRKEARFVREMELTLRDADVVIIDEAHHFRNPGVKGEGASDPSRYRKLQNWLHEGTRRKQLFFLTATPINNSVHDFRHLIELFTNGNEQHFAQRLGIHNLRSHFIQLEKHILARIAHTPNAAHTPAPAPAATANVLEAGRALRGDIIFDTLVVQRSRAYVKESQRQQDAGQAIFPVRSAPKVAKYNLKTTYGKLLEGVGKAFNKKNPLFVLSIYYPLNYLKTAKQDTPEAKWDEARQKQVVSLIRTLFLKRFESSASAFESSCWRLLKKLLAWVAVHTESDHDSRRLERWKTQNAEITGHVHAHQQELWPEENADEEADQLLDDDTLADVQKLDPSQYNLPAMLDDCYDDLNQLAKFLELLANVKTDRDDKLKALVKLLKTDKVLKQEKVLIFTEFADTARYLRNELKNAGITGIEQIDGNSTQPQRSDAIRRFAPYYNELDTATLAADGKTEIRILIATDILAEGLNLQDSSRIINYDIHWNPVRLMQRIGRVDRRLNPAIEKRILADHPERKNLRAKVEFWNFIPPDELDELLRLFQRVANKTLVISRTLGIENSQLLTPDDDYDPIRELNEHYDGTLTGTEKLRLEYNDLVKNHPASHAALARLPLKSFSGKTPPDPGTRAIFFCHRIPRPDTTLVPSNTPDGATAPRWSDAAGLTVWTCHDLDGNTLLTEPSAIATLIRSEPETPRRCALEKTTLGDLRKKVEKQLTTDHLKPLQAPLGITPILKCWMEIS